MFMNTSSNYWFTEYQSEIAAAPEKIWAYFCDVPGWKNWNAGIEEIEIKGPFAAGTVFIMKPPGQDSLISTIVEVQENELFVDRTAVGDLIITVSHKIERLGSNQSCVVYSVQAVGPGCEDVGPAVSADFPDVLDALRQIVESSCV